MGNFLFPPKSRKRKFDAMANSSKEHLPKRVKKFKFTNTSEYIFKSLFEESQGSDITIRALDHSWKLHRIYLRQSPYFNSMFTEGWVESGKDDITITIDDKNITKRAIDVVFGALYQDEVHVHPTEALSVLACSNLFQISHVTALSIETMKKNINRTSAFEYYEAADVYSSDNLKNFVICWIAKHFLVNISKDTKCLKLISPDLMIKILASDSLIVIGTETHLYEALKWWMFLLCSDDDGPEKSKDDMTAFYNRPQGSISFLETETGLPFKGVFQCLRLSHMLRHLGDVEILEVDNIIPNNWMLQSYKLLWRQLLHVETEQGLNEIMNMKADEFFKCCERYGRVIKEDVMYCWRWKCFDFKCTLAISYKDREFVLRRLPNSYRYGIDPDEEPVSVNSASRPIQFSIAIFTLSSNGNLEYLSKVPNLVTTLSLKENQRYLVAKLPENITFPLVFSAKFMYVPLKVVNFEPGPTQAIEDCPSVNL